MPILLKEKGVVIVIFSIIMFVIIQHIYVTVKPKSINIIIYVKSNFLQLLGLQTIEKLLMLSKCDKPEVLGDYTLKKFRGEEGAKKYWEDHYPEGNLKAANYYDS